MPNGYVHNLALTLACLALLSCGGGSKPKSAAPLAAAVEATTAEDTTVTVMLKGTASGTGLLTYRVATPPSHGTVVVSGAEALYTPAPDWNGTETFTYTATEGQRESAPATVSITVTPVPDAPVAGDVDLATMRGQSIEVPFAVSDADGDAVTVTVLEQPFYGVLQTSAGVVTYVPPPGFHGADSFDYFGSDGTLTSGIASVTVTVSGIPSADPLQLTAAAAFDRNANENSRGTTAISADGRFVFFYSEADNLVTDDGNGERDVFRRDMRKARLSSWPRRRSATGARGGLALRLMASWSRSRRQPPSLPVTRMVSMTSTCVTWGQG